MRKMCIFKADCFQFLGGFSCKVPRYLHQLILEMGDNTAQCNKQDPPNPNP